ncbi:MAG: peptidyl-prolyl cis-trans isomerase [Myxococcota bacterium]
MRSTALLVVLGLALGVGLAARAQPDTPTAAPAPPTEATPAADERSPEDEARRARALATVNGERITVGEVEDLLARQNPFLRSRFADPARLQEFVQDLVKVRLLAAEAERRGYDEHPLVVRAVKQAGVQMLMRTEFEERIRPETIPEEDVRAYYEAHIDEFRREAMVRASSILVGTRDEATALLEELKDTDLATFRRAARDHSIDPYTKLRGGDLRYFTRAGLPARGNPDDEPVAQELIDAAFALAEEGENGDISAEPVAVREDFAILMLTGKREADEAPYQQAEGNIRIRLWRERRQESLDTFVSDLRQRAQPEIHAERMDPIQLAVEPPNPGLPTTGESAMDEAPAEASAPTTDAPAPAGDTPSVE